MSEKANLDYVEQHPELKPMLSEFLSSIIVRKPSNLYHFAAEYFATLAKENPAKCNSPLIVCGPSGVGKGTLMKKLFQAFPDKLGLSVSHTTRKPREGEVDGTHYFFTDKEDFKKKINDEEFFIEFAQVHDNYYGTSFKGVQQVQDQNKVCVLEIDVQGAKKVKSHQLKFNPHVLYIAPPSMEVLEERLRERGSENDETLATRLKNAKDEMSWLEANQNADAKIINDDLDKAYEELVTVVKNWYPQLSASN